MSTPTLTPPATTEQAAPAPEATTTAEPPTTAATAPPHHQPALRRLLHWHYPVKTFIIALEVLALLLIGVLAGVVITLTVLLTNVVKSLPPTAVLPGSHGWSTIIVENPRDWHDDHLGSGGIGIPDVASPTQPAGQGPTSTPRTR